MNSAQLSEKGETPSSRAVRCSSKPKDRFYVYALFRANGLIFYIGKGQGRRCFVNEIENTHRSWVQRVIDKMKKDGQEIPVVILHSNLKEATAFEYEVVLIKAIGRFPNGPLVNRRPGGEGVSPSDLTRDKMSQSATGKVLSTEHKEALRVAGANRKLTEEIRSSYRTAGTVWTGRKHSSASKLQMSVTHTGKTLTPEHRRNIGNSGRGKKLKTSPNRGYAWIGRRHTEESLQKMRDTIKRNRGNK